jgi:Glycosyl transferase family group 2
MPNLADPVLAIIGPVLFVAISVIGVRLFAYWGSFLRHWPRYRRLDDVSTRSLRQMPVPFVKIQVTTRGSAGSTEVIMRGIRNVIRLAEENPAFYGQFLSVEVVTDAAPQAQLLNYAFADAVINVEAIVLPADYETQNGTKLKARGLHYAVERRRAGWNAKSGRTFIVHYDEESVMVPSELRKLIACLATTDKKLLEGPIYYPLEYLDASVICRAMEANRPIGCYECRHVMEAGVPLHLHGSNLVIDEAMENDIGWDIGCLDGQPFIAEDYVFGMNVFVTYGREVFGWHGCVMLEQPPFSFKTAFKQRHRWTFGTLQGMAMIRQHPDFPRIPTKTRLGVIWGTRYRIATFALGAIVGALSLTLTPVFLPRVVEALIGNGLAPLPWPATLWLAALGLMWLGSVFIGAWYNVGSAGLSRWGRTREIAQAVTVAPVAGLLECSAGLWAVVEWSMGRRTVQWNTTPKTKQADVASNRSKQPV